MHEYIAAGAVAVGVASSLVSSPEQSMEDLANKALELVEAWNKAKGH
jgi:2-keto-3-deoxy-6-phosphogluconate aldolase